MTELKLALNSCGLTGRKAAEFLKIKHTTLRARMTGKRPAPPRWLKEMKVLSNLIQAQAAMVLDKEKRGGMSLSDDFFKYFAVRTDAEAQALGLPYVECCEKVCEIIWANRPTF